jgi:hypothetical protein
MEEEKIRSFALLMAFKLPDFIMRTIQDIGIDDPEVISILKSYKIDIYNWSLDSGDIEFLVSNLKIIRRKSILDEKTALYLFNKLSAIGVEFVEFDIEIMTRRYCFVVNKYIHQNELLKKIFANYLALKKHQKDIEIGSRKFANMQSEYTYDIMKELFSQMDKYHSPINNRILNNLPFDVLNEFSSESYSKVLTLLKRKLASELFPYIDSINANISLKEFVLGLAFAAYPS